MKTNLIIFLRTIHRFGFLNGINISFKNMFFKKGTSEIKIKSYLYPFSLRRSTSDIATFHQVFLNLEYQYKINIQPKLIIDCRANIGLATVYFKNLYPKASIIAIEPETSNFEMLTKNTKKYPDITCLQSGIWHKNAILKVEDEYNMGNWGFTCKEVESENDDTIKAISLDQVMKENNFSEIDILKIDIEGAELELFSDNYQNWLPKTRVIMIELHDRFRKGCSKSFFTAIVKYDFSIYNHGENIICIRN